MVYENRFQKFWSQTSESQKSGAQTSGSQFLSFDSPNSKNCSLFTFSVDYIRLKGDGDCQGKEKKFVEIDTHSQFILEAVRGIWSLKVGFKSVKYSGWTQGVRISWSRSWHSTLPSHSTFIVVIKINKNLTFRLFVEIRI